MFSAIKSTRLTGNPYTSDQPMKIHEGFGVSLGAALKAPPLRGIVPSYLADASEFAPPPTGSTIMTSGALVMDGNFEGRTAGNQLRSNRTFGAHASDVAKYTDAQINFVTQSQKTREGMSRPEMAIPMRFSHEGFKGFDAVAQGAQQVQAQLARAREMTHPTYAAQMEAVASGLLSADPRMRGVMNMVQRASQREPFTMSRLGASKTGSTTTTLKDMAASSEPFRRRRW